MNILNSSSAILDVTTLNTGLKVTFASATKPVSFSWFWLRDHGIDPASLDVVTKQRLVDTFSIPQDLRPATVNFDQEQQLIVIEWVGGENASDREGTTISASLLAGAAGIVPESHVLAPTRKRVLWDENAPLSDIPSLSFSAVMENDEGLLAWLENIAVYGFSVVTDVPSTESGTKELAERIGKAQETIFGGMWRLSAELMEHADSAYTTGSLEPHTDSSYYHDAPGLQMFNCLEFDGEGGESVQVDGFAIAARIKDEDPDAYKTLTEIVVPGQYFDENIHLHAERPPFQLNAKGELIQVTFNNYDRAPFLLSDEDTVRFHHAYGLFHKYASDQRNWLKIPLRPGMTLIFDNWRNLHGRMAYTGKRVFYGCYHSRADYESKLRVLQAK